LTSGPTGKADINPEADGCKSGNTTCTSVTSGSS
jgi:hypothetical protein